MRPQRVLGEQLPLSIPTAIPFEEVILHDDKKPVRLIVSLRTLFRNYTTSFAKDDVVHLAQMIEEFNDELDNIKAYCAMQRIQCILYECNYTKLERAFPMVIRPDTWDAKVDFFQMYEKVKAGMNQSYTTFDVNFPLPMRSPEKEYIITSYPVDLLVLRAGVNTSLLESHTAAIKPPTEWITKLTSNQKYHSWPFNKFTYQLLGDRSLTNKGAPQKLRNVVLTIATENRWKQHQTIGRCQTDIKRAHISDDLKKEILKYF